MSVDVLSVDVLSVDVLSLYPPDIRRGIVESPDRLLGVLEACERLLWLILVLMSVHKSPMNRSLTLTSDLFY